MITQESPLFPAELEAIAKRIATDITSEGLRLPCCSNGLTPKTWRREIAGETLYVSVGRALQLSLAERSARGMLAAYERYCTLRWRSRWSRNTTPQEVEIARENLEAERRGIEKRWAGIERTLEPLLESLVRDFNPSVTGIGDNPGQCYTGLCRTYNIR